MKDRIGSVLNFLGEIEKFKLIERELFLSGISRKESDAEHSWHLAMFVLLFEKEIPQELDKTKMLKMALIHDLPEIYSGDTWAFDKEGRKDKKEREAKAAEKLFSALPQDLSHEMKEIFEEYEKNESEESKIVRALDKIQPLLQNLVSDGESWKRNKVTKEMIEASKKPHLKDDLTKQIYEKLMEDIDKEGLL